MKKIDRFFYYDRGEPLHGSDDLCQKLADLVNEKGIRIENMTQDQLSMWVKPMFKECGVEWSNTPAIAR